MPYLKTMEKTEIWTLNLNQLNKIIDEFGLHTNYPANPMPLYRKIDARLSKQDLPFNRLAFSGWHPKFKKPFAFFDTSLKGEDLNHALWHELSHLLFDQPGQIYCFGTHPKHLHQRSEFLCELRAAYLSVPYHEMMQMYQDGWYDTQVAGALRVPVTYLKLRHDIFIRKAK